MEYLSFFSIEFVYFTSFLSALIGLTFIVTGKCQAKPVLFGVILLTISLIQVYFNLVATKALMRFPHLFLLYIPFFFLLGPLVFLFFKLLSRDHVPAEPKTFLHFLPSIASVLLLLPYFFSSTENKRMMMIQLYRSHWTWPHIPFSVLSAVSLIIYVVLLQKRHPAMAEVKGDQSRRLFYSFCLMNGMLVFIAIAGLLSVNYSTSFLQFINVLPSLWLAGFFLTHFRFTDFFEKMVAEFRKGRYERSHLVSVDLEELDTALNDAMEKDKLYTDQGLTLNKLAKTLGVTPHQLSEYLNNRKGVNFNSFVTAYRVGEAKSMLLKYPWRTTLSIAMEVGFNSHSTFNRCFKRVTGISPGSYRKQIEKQK